MESCKNIFEKQCKSICNRYTDWFLLTHHVNRLWFKVLSLLGFAIDADSLHLFEQPGFEINMR